MRFGAEGWDVSFGCGLGEQILGFGALRPIVDLYIRYSPEP